MRKKSTSLTSTRPLIVDFIGGSLNHRLNFGGGIKQNLAKQLVLNLVSGPILLMQQQDLEEIVLFLRLWAPI